MNVQTVIETTLDAVALAVARSPRGVGTPKDEEAYRVVAASYRTVRRARRAGRMDEACALVTAQLEAVAALPRGLAEQADHHFRESLGV